MHGAFKKKYKCAHSATLAYGFRDSFDVSQTSRDLFFGRMNGYPGSRKAASHSLSNLKVLAPMHGRTLHDLFYQNIQGALYGTSKKMISGQIYL